MKKIPERIYVRKHLRVPVICEDVVSGKFFQGVMHDLSVEGMRLELDEYLQPGAQIEVKLHMPVAGFYQKASYQNLRLEVIWCKEKKNSGQIAYGAGVRRIVPERLHPDILKAAGKGRRYRSPLSF